MALVCFRSCILNSSSMPTALSGFANNSQSRTEWIAYLLIPVAMALYTLFLVGHAHAYEVSLASISALLATITGFHIVFVLYSSTTSITGASWPAACGKQSPQWICEVTLGFGDARDPQLFSAGGTIVLDLLIIILVVRCCSSRLDGSTHSRILRFPRLIGARVRSIGASVFEIIAAYGLLTCAGVEIWFLRLVLRSGNLSTDHNWSFGQIAGITIWPAVIVDLIRYELCKWRIFLLTRASHIDGTALIWSGLLWIKRSRIQFVRKR